MVKIPPTYANEMNGELTTRMFWIGSILYKLYDFGPQSFAVVLKFVSDLTMPP